MLKKFIFSRRPARRSARLFKLFFISTGEMTGAPVGAKIQNFEIFKIMKMLKNDFNKITTWKSDQEEFYIMMFGISKWIHIIHRILFEFRISSLVQQFRADRRAGGTGLFLNLPKKVEFYTTNTSRFLLYLTKISTFQSCN